MFRFRTNRCLTFGYIEVCNNYIFKHICRFSLDEMLRSTYLLVSAAIRALSSSRRFSLSLSIFSRSDSVFEMSQLSRVSRIASFAT